MSGWVWLVGGWLVAAPVAAVVVGGAMRTADQRDWARRGRPERRTRTPGSAPTSAVGVLVGPGPGVGQQRRQLGQLVQAGQAQPFQEQRGRHVEPTAGVRVGAGLPDQSA